MHIAATWKWGVVPLALLSGWLAIRVTKAQPHPGPPAQGAAVAGRLAPTSTKAEVAPVPPSRAMTAEERRILAAATQASGSLDRYEVLVEGDCAKVRATVTLTDIRPDQVFIWRLRALDPADESTTHDTIYDEQGFQIDRSRPPIYTFTESLPLPPGRHRVVLALYSVKRETAREQILAHNDLRYPLVLNALKEIEIK